MAEIKSSFFFVYSHYFIKLTFFCFLWIIDMEQVCENAVPVGEENSTETRFLYIILKIKQAVPFFKKKGHTLYGPVGRKCPIRTMV